MKVEVTAYRVKSLNGRHNHSTRRNNHLATTHTAGAEKQLPATLILPLSEHNTSKHSNSYSQLSQRSC